jgi:hypothetical protein
MNNLSWFLYFADILPKAGGFAIFLAFVFGFGSILYTVAKGFANGGGEDAQAFVDVPVIKYSVLAFIASCSIALFTPSRDTMYLIAGSEAGEFVVNTPEAKAILSDIQEVIQLQIQGLKPSDSKPTN